VPLLPQWQIFLWSLSNDKQSKLRRITGHCHLKGHLFKLGLTDDPICERCREEDESATHILCDCEAVAHARFRHLGQFFHGIK
jgi:hypothetical protein